MKKRKAIFMSNKNKYSMVDYVALSAGCASALVGAAMFALGSKGWIAPEESSVASVFCNRFMWAAIVSGVIIAVASVVGILRNKQRNELISEASPKWSATELFIISFLILFIELAFIRWIPSYTRMLSYFSNFVLLACFLGMGAGCLLAPRKTKLLPFAPAVIFILVGFVLLLFVLNMGNIAGNVIWGEAAKKSEIFMGNNYLTYSLSNIPIELTLIVIFVLTAGLFLGLGQVLGQAMETMPPLRAYSVNIGGSVVGIAAITGIAFFSAPAPLWFFAGFIGLGWFVIKSAPRSAIINTALLLCAFSFIALFSMKTGNYKSLWSPYYKISYEDKWPNYRVFSTNEVGHQVIWPENNHRIVKVSVPFLMYKNSYGSPPEDVMIIGAGTGNDVNLALKIGAKHIDAVEIDPVILNMGKQENPMKPYQSPRVTPHLVDGRAFLEQTTKQYDLIAFSVLDSLTLFSSYSSLHLESYLFTEECFTKIKERLKPNGVFAFYNFNFHSWHVIRTHMMMEKVFGAPVALITIPYRGAMTAQTESQYGLTVFLAGNISPIMEKLEATGGLYLLDDSGLNANLTINGFETELLLKEKPEKAFELARLTATENDPDFIMPTDDWPFYYKRHKSLAPHDYRGLAVILFCSLAFIGFSAGREMLKFSPHFFFLGGGFMLLQVVSITRLALLYGTTWIVNSIVFFSILTMAFFANLLVIKLKPQRIALTYILLLATIVLSWAAPLQMFAGMGAAAKFALSSVVTFLPIVFSGIIFSTSFSASRYPAAHFGSNLLGIIIGGMAVYMASILGYQDLLVVVFIIYALSWATARLKSS